MSEAGDSILSDGLLNLHTDTGYNVSTEVVGIEVDAAVKTAVTDAGKTTCGFETNGASATVKVTVRDEAHYPVFSGEAVGFENMQLTFLVRYDTQAGETVQEPGVPAEELPEEGSDGGTETLSITAPQGALANAEIAFTGTVRIEGVQSYEWDFGDGQVSKYTELGEDGEALRPRHTYTSPGTYTVTLRVTVGDEEAAASATVEVTESIQA